MSNQPEYGSAHVILRHTRKNKDSDYYDPPYPQPTEVKDEPRVNTLTQKELEAKNAYVQRIDTVIRHCFQGKFIKQRGLVPIKNLFEKSHSITSQYDSAKRDMYSSSK